MNIPDFVFKGIAEKLYDCYNIGYEDCRTGKDKMLSEEFIKRFNDAKKSVK